MKVKKMIKSTTDIDIHITGITLLSFDEYKEYKDAIPNCYSVWWLRTPSYCSSHAGNDKSIFSNMMAVCADGTVNGKVDTGEPSWQADSICVRPVLLLADTNDTNLCIGDTIYVANTEWTIISNSMAISTFPIDIHCFHADLYDYPSCYEESDIKEFLDHWAEDKGLAFEKAKL